MRIGLVTKAGQLAVRSPKTLRTAVAVTRARLTYLEREALLDLALAVLEADRAGRPGVILEAGTALGGSAIVITTAKRRERPLVAHDMFGMIPAPTAQDGPDVHERYNAIVSGRSSGIGGDEYYGYRTDLRGQVERSFERFGVPIADNSVRLVQGLFQETIQGDEPIALAHLDGDWYESTKVCLDRVAPRLARGGRIIIDDYDDWSGCRTAVEEFMDGNTEFRRDRRACLHLVKI